MNKTINHIFLSLLFSAIAATVASCTDELDLPADSSDIILLPGEYRFIIGHDDEPHLSRVEYTDEKSSRFETGDRIGVFATNSDKQIQNDVFSARALDGKSVQVLAPPKGTVTQGLDTVIPTGEGINYIFYHPMNPEWKLSDITQGTGLSYSVEPDQSSKEAYERSDFLWNYLNSKPEEPIQVIKMHHLMANIIVRIHRDSIDNSNDADNGVTLKNIHTSASNIQLTEQLNKEMNYHVAANGTVSDIKMYCQGESGEYLIYRAAVPAWQTLAEGSEIISVNLFNRAGNTEKVTYTLAAPLSLRDGYYYTFTLRSAVKPAVPEVSDDDSWVLDVVDPENPSKIVGLLCREYLHYQPTAESNISPDIRTTPGGFTHYGKPDQWSGNRVPKYYADPHISSQAWVFYNLQEDSELPYLKEGTVLRFVYDIICSQSTLGGDAWYDIWPAPHKYGNLLNGQGGTAQGMFLTRHGHEWVATAEGHGDSSTEGNEYFMHGAKITWGKIDTDPDVKYYYDISKYEKPELKTTNHDALFNGHIAIPEKGEPYVSYEPFDETTMREVADPTIKVGVTIPKYLEDSRDGLSYPLIKIGYNNFWMSKSYRSKILADGTEIVCQNKDAAGSTDYKDYVKFKDAETLLDKPSYLYAFNPGLKVNVYNFSNRDNFPYLYNYTAIKDEKFIPDCQDHRMKTTLPQLEHLNRIAKYVGWKFAAKLLTGETAVRQPDGTFLNTAEYALSLNKIYDNTQNSYNCNVSGFNLRTNGFYQAYMGMSDTFGHQCSLWVSDNIGAPYDNAESTSENEGLKYISFSPFAAFSTSHDHFSTNDRTVSSFNPNASKEGRAVQASQLFVAVRFILKFAGQDDSDEFFDIMPISSAIKSLSRSASAQPADKPESTVISVPVIESKD
ncbi:MAG: fimbrillin family protein [Bacteroides sp.]|nr:fimbrillin family protein [Bacteroides sp.]MCM1389356.1 fimbrillin family protein [Bacteroides sp.]